MFVLAIVEPFPAVGQTQVEAQLVERGVGIRQAVVARCPSPGLGIEELLVDVQCCRHHPGGHGLAERTGKAFRFGDEPLQEVEYAGQYDEVFHGFSFAI